MLKCIKRRIPCHLVVFPLNIMLTLTILLVVGTAATQLFDKPYYDLNDANNLFKNFIQEHGKTYDPEEYLRKFEIFKENLIEINERNAKHPQTVFKVNRFADLTLEERVARHGLQGRLFELDAVELHYPPERITAPEQFDWRDRGVVTRVKDQTSACGSCWIFSATGAIESQYAIKYNKTIAFSEQQSLDCVKLEWNNCEGGCSQYAMAYHKTFGVVPEKDYPYLAKQSVCHEDSAKVVTKVTGYNVYMPDEETLKQLVYEIGPVAVTVDPSDFHFHEKGILYPDHCHDSLIHEVLLVGYGVENGTKYWILKDSYGTDLGEGGYHRLLRGVNACSMGTSSTVTCTVE